MTRTFSDGHPKVLPACNFLSQYYFYNIFTTEVLQVFSSNSYEVRGGENRKWRWIFAFDRCVPLARFNTGSPRFADFPSLCACSESSLTNLIGCDPNLLCLQSHSKTECRWTRPEVAILGADQKERGLWGREWTFPIG